MNSEQNSTNIHEGDDIQTHDNNEEANHPNDTERTPESDAHENHRERGEIVNEASQIDPFWQSHPDLLDEAKQMGAPLKAKDFKEQGFTIGREDDGKMHIWATNPRYKEWERNGKKGKVPQHYENLNDQKYRKTREEYFASLRDKRRIDEEYNERLTEHQRRLEDIKGNLEELIEKEHVDVFSPETVDFVYDTLYPDGINGARDKVVKQLIVKGLKESEDNISVKASRRINDLYEEAYSNAFRNDSLQIPDQTESLKEIKNSLTLNFKYPGKRKFENDAKRVVEPLLEIYKDKELPNIPVLPPSDKDLQKIKTDMSKEAIMDGAFFPNTFSSDPSGMDEIMTEIGIDKTDGEIVELALLGYGDRSDGAEIDYFNLKDEVAKRIYNKNNGLYLSSDRKKLIFQDWYYEKETILSPEVSGEAVGRITEANDRLIEHISNDRELDQLVERNLEENSNRERDYLAGMLYSGSNSVSFSHYLDIKKIGLSSSKVLDNYFDDLLKKEPLKKYIDREGLQKATPVIEKEISPNYKEVLFNGLMERLETGVRKKGRNERYLAEIFETEDFLKNQEALGIDFNDPRLFEPAFRGFLNTIESRNGELSRQADWYYDTIFANDAGKFLAMLQAYKGSEECRQGTKGKITRFFKNNSQAFEDKVQHEIEKRIKEEINGEKRAIKTSVLRNASRGDIKKIIDDYKRYHINQAKERAAVEISTFDGRKKIFGEQEETGEKERKETPFDFGLEKVVALERWSDFIEANYPNANVSWFTDTFPQGANDTKLFERGDSYIGFSFEYEGHLCVIAESLNEQAAMYLWRSEIGEDFTELFDLSKFDAKRTSDPRIADVDHLDKEHFDDSLDLSYRKALLFFRTGDKDIVNYKYFYRENSAQAKEDWQEYQDLEYPAWPLGLDENGGDPEDVIRYREWQERQDLLQTRLKEAVKRGGQEELEAERRRIAQEEYDRIMNDVA